MATEKPHETALRETLRKAYFEKEQLAVGDRWQAGVMRRIRNIEPDDKTVGFIELFESFVWRLAPGVCLLLLVLTTLWFNVEFVPEVDVFHVFLEDADISPFQQLISS